MAYNFKKKTTQSENPVDDRTDKNLHGKCEAWGCNRWGHVHTGKWHCRYHLACHGKNIAEQLNHVSMILKNHEPEFNWYEHLLCSNEVDFVCGDLKKRAPVGMEVEAEETFRQYRDRIEMAINTLLAFEIIPNVDRKKLASGERPEERFNNFGDFAPMYN